MDRDEAMLDVRGWTNPYVSISGKYIALRSKGIPYGRIQIPREKIDPKLREAIFGLPSTAWPSGQKMGISRHYVNLDREDWVEDNKKVVIAMMKECGLEVVQLSYSLQT